VLATAVLLDSNTGLGRGRARRTGCVSELILLPLYPVLQALGIAPCDLDLLLDGFGTHICHAPTSRLVGEMLSRRRCGEARLDPGAAQREQPETETRLRQEQARKREVAGALEQQHLVALDNGRQRLLECEFGEREGGCGRGRG
jgi:hypothetical protein